MFDVWIDGKGRTLLNFLVYCPRGQCLLDPLMHLFIKDVTLLCESLDDRHNMLCKS